jgi:hypothetical protein
MSLIYNIIIFIFCTACAIIDFLILIIYSAAITTIFHGTG